MLHSIWVIEDDPIMQAVYLDMIGKEYQLHILSSLEEFSLHIDQHPNPDVVILDLVLNGRQMHQSFSQFVDFLKKQPFLVISGLDNEQAVRASIECGAADFISKPFSGAELRVKVEMLLQKYKRTTWNKFLIEIDPLTMTASNKQGDFVALTSKEFQILNLLLDSNNKMVARHEFYQIVWRSAKVTNKTLDVHLRNLRKKLHNLGATLASGEEGYAVIPHNEPNHKLVNRACV